MNPVVEKHLDIVNAFHHAYVSEMTGEGRTNLLMGLLELRRGIRWYQTCVPTQIADIWNDLRKDMELLDYVMLGTSDLFLKGLDNDAEKQRFFDTLAESWTWSSRHCAIDQQLKDRSPTWEFARSQLENNSWLVFVYLHQFNPQLH